METLPFARRVSKQLARSRALLANAPRRGQVERLALAVAVEQSEAMADVVGPARQRGNANGGLLVAVVLACALGAGVAYGIHHVGVELTSALAQVQAKR